MTKAPEQESGKVSLRKKLLWGAGGAADNIFYNGMNSLVLPIFNVGLGVDAVKLGYAIGLPRLLDAIIDPLIGNYSDNLRTRWGRRRPLIFLGAILAGLLVGLLFCPPRFLGGEQLVWWFLGISCLFYIAYAFFMIPYSALGLELTDDYDERTRVLAWRPYLGIVAGLGIPWLYKLCLLIGPNEAEGARTVGWMVGGIALLLGIIPALFLKERERMKSPHELPLLQSLRTTFRNRSFLAVTGCTLAILLGWFLATPLGLYLTIFYLFSGDKGAAATFSGISGTVLIGAGFLGLPFSTWLSARLGKRQAMLAMLFACMLFIASTWWLFVPAAPWLSLIPIFAAGFCINGCFLLGASMLGDVCDADELETGLRREGIYSASLEFGKKFAIGISTLLTGYVIALAGIDPSHATQASSTITTLRLAYILVLASPLFFAGLCIWFYPLSRERALEIREEIEAKAGNR